MWSVILFIFGLAIGSFLNVVALRYDGDHFVFDAKMIGGRSHCPHCKKTLEWFELFPLLSFLFLRGRCRHCHAKIGFQYPIVELISALIFALVPLRAGGIGPSVFWVIAFETLLLISYIDILLGIIPDELNLLLWIVGIFFVLFFDPHGIPGHLLGALFGGGFFLALVLATRGKGMGMGDVKLAFPLGFLFGWPGIVLLTGASFIIGAAAGIVAIVRGTKTIKASLPFGPFLAIGALIIFFFGAAILRFY
jgi:prepilin signal peptidase PulO-like enzyme (type II secretory pathway)